MKKYLIFFVWLFLFSNSAFASPPTPVCYQATPGVCVTVAPSTPLPVGVYGGAGATLGFCLTSNGPGTLATFQACSGGGGGSVSVTAAEPSTVVTPSPGVGTFTVGNNYTLSTSASGVLPNANGGDGLVAGLTFNSTGAGTANSTAINAALAAGGKVTLDCPAATPNLYIGATLKVFSNSQFVVQPSCTIIANSGVSPLLENEAVSSSWTRLYNASGIVANGALSLIRVADITGWSTSRSFTAGTYANAGGNYYWESVASCTSASTGSGPTGTGTGITDGSCSWNYITTAVPSAVTNVTPSSSVVVINWPSHGLTQGSAIWITPQPDSGGSTAKNGLWTGSQTAHTQGGLADSAYFGIFRVVTVNDSNNITVTLNRAAITAFTGIPMNIKQADVNITVAGGALWNYNYPTNNSCGTSITCHGMIFAGIYNFKIDGPIIENAVRYAFELAGITNGDIRNLSGGPLGTTEDFMKVYGPAVNLAIHGIHATTGGDDFFSLQPEEPAAFSAYTMACGDMTGISIDHADSSGGDQFAIWLSNPYLWMDDIDISHVTNNGEGGLSVVRFRSDGGLAASPVGRVHIHDISGSQIAQAIVYFYSDLIATFQQVDIDNITTSVNSNGYPDAVVVAAGTITQLNIKNVTGAGYGTSVSFAGGTVTQAVLDNISLISPSNGYMVVVNGTTLGTLDLRNSYIPLTDSGGLIDDHQGTKITLENNTNLGTGNAVNVRTSGTVVRATGNYMPNLGYGILQMNTTSNATLYSGGNNLGSSAWIVYSSAGTVTPYGFDIPCDVTKVTRTTGAYCNNTNAAPGSGTLTTAGPIMDQGTSANSWFLMANPSGQQY